MKNKTSIWNRFRMVLRSTGTLGDASVDKFVNNFCDEVERTACETVDERTTDERGMEELEEKE